MTCDFFKPLILEYLDNELESEQVRQLENHLGQCPHCSKQTDEFRSLLGLVIPPSVSYPSADIWNGFSADIVSQVETSMIKPDQNFTNSWAKISSIGWRVAACLLLAIGTLIYYTINQDSKSKRNITAQLDGPRKMLRLPRQTTSPLIPEINIVIQEIENVLVQDESYGDMLSEHPDYLESATSVQTSNTLSETTIDSIDDIIATLLDESRVDEDVDFSINDLASLY